MMGGVALSIPREKRRTLVFFAWRCPYRGLRADMANILLVDDDLENLCSLQRWHSKARTTVSAWPEMRNGRWISYKTNRSSFYRLRDAGH